MSTFLARYPAVIGELILSDRMVNLVEEGVDAAVRIGVLADSSLFARKVGETRRVVVASPEYLARRKKPQSPGDIASHDVIQFTGLNPTPEWRFSRDGTAATSRSPPRSSPTAPMRRSGTRSSAGG